MINKAMGVSEYLFPKFILYHIIVLSVIFLAYKQKKSSYLLHCGMVLYGLSLFMQRFSGVAFLLVMLSVVSSDIKLNERYLTICLVFFILIDVLGILIISPILGVSGLSLAQRNEGMRVINMWDKGHALTVAGLSTSYRAQPFIENNTELRVVVIGLLNDGFDAEKNLSELLGDRGLFIEESEYGQWEYLAKFYGISISPNPLFNRSFKKESFIYMDIYDSEKGADGYYLLLRGKHNG